MEQYDDKHPIDQWDEDAAKSNDAFNKQRLMDASLIYAVFCTPQGKELLEKWTKTLIYTPVADPSFNDIAIGINEGEKKFVRSILHNIKIYEDES